MKKLIMISLGLLVMLNGCFEKRADTVVLKMKGLKEDQELIKAINVGNIAKVIEALKKGGNPNAEINNKKAIHAAAINGDVKVMETLLKAGADKDAIDKEGWTALMLAARKGYAEIVELLVEGKVNKDSVNKEGNTALMLASYYGHLEVVYILMKGEINKEAKNTNGWTALHIASANGYKEIVELLLRAGADKDGMKAFMLAAENGSKEVVTLLLDKGAKINEKDDLGRTALMLAAQNGHNEVVALLLDRGAKIDEKDQLGKTVLIKAVIFRQIKVVELLLDRGAKIDENMGGAATALIIAAQNGYKKIVKILLNKGASIDEKMGDGWTALIAATEFGHYKVVKLLLSRGAKIDENSKELYFSIIHGRIDIFKLLYRNRANVNVENMYGGTAIVMLYCLAIEDKKYRPLFLSIINHELKIMRKLLQKRIYNISIKLGIELSKIHEMPKEEEALQALKMVMACDDLIKYEIFKNVLEMPQLYRYIMENPKLTIDDKVFEIKCEKEKIKKFRREDIIGLYFGIEFITDEKQQKANYWCNIA